MTEVSMADLGAMCFVPMERLEEIDPRSLRRAFAQAAPRSSLILESRFDDTSIQAFSAIVDGQQFALALYAGQLPPPTFPLNPQRCLFWQRAPEEIAEHSAFLVVSAAEPHASHGLVRAQSTAMTRLCAALVEELPAMGLIWAEAETCSKPNRIAQAPSEIARGKWPVDIWIGFQYFGVDHGDHREIGLQTRGASRYLGFELRIPPFEAAEIKEPLRILFNAVAYLMNFGDVIRDGQVVEVSGERRVGYQLHLGVEGKPGLAELTVLKPEENQLH